MHVSRFFMAIMYVTVAALAVIVGVFILFDPFGSLDSGTGAATESGGVQVPILMYHHFADDGTPGTTISAEVFESHLKALRDAGYTVVTFEQLVDFVDSSTPLPESPVVITIDDGYMSVYEVAYPLLRQYGMQATSFIIGVSFGRDVYKDTTYPIIPRFGDSEALEMSESGLVSIQSHSFDMHQYEPYETGSYRRGVLMRSDESEREYIAAFTEDFNLSAGQIESMLGSRAFVYSYPYGIHTDLTEGLLRDMGVRVTLTIEPGVNTVVPDDPESLFAMKRFNVPGDITPETLLAMVGEYSR